MQEIIKGIDWICKNLMYTVKTKGFGKYFKARF